MTATPRPLFGWHMLITVLIGMAQTLLWLAVGIYVLRIGTQFEKIFADFGTELPFMTAALLRLSHFFARYWYVAFPPVLLWNFVYWGVDTLLGLSPQTAPLRWLWRVGTWLVPLATIAFVVVALVGPLVSLINKLS